VKDRKRTCAFGRKQEETSQCGSQYLLHQRYPEVMWCDSMGFQEQPEKPPLSCNCIGKILKTKNRKGTTKDVKCSLPLTTEVVQHARSLQNLHQPEPKIE
jgi:hypothetical protein